MDFLILKTSIEELFWLVTGLPGLRTYVWPGWSTDVAFANCARPLVSSSITIEGSCRLQQNEKGQRGLVKKSRQRVKTILLECEWDGMGMASDQSSSRQQWVFYVSQKACSCL